MRILTDFHHHALAESLLLLFEDRYDAQVYFPRGMEWFDQEYWNFERTFHEDRVARQYLEGIWPADSVDSTGARSDPRYPGRKQFGITLDEALQSRFDVVLSSLPHNYDGYYRLAQKLGARYGIQIGNEAQELDPRADFIMASATLPGFGPEWAGKRFEIGGKPAVMYHQEFDLEMFRPGWPPYNRRVIASFVNCFPEGPSYPEFSAFALAHPEFDWRVYGACGTPGPDAFTAGDIGPVPLVADEMRAARVGWHSKHWSDGFGHVIHNWFAIGRPVIGYARYYVNRLAGPLWVEGVTSFDLELRGKDELAELLERLCSDDDYHRQISEAAAARFREVVDFDAEAALIAEMVGL